MTDGEELFDKLLNSTNKAEIMILFHKNPGLVDHIDGISRKIGASRTLIEADVEDLVHLGILNALRTGRNTIVSLNGAKDREIQEMMVKHLMSKISKP